MPNNKKNGGGCLGLIAIPLFIAVATGSTLPWWWDKLLDSIYSSAPPPFAPLPTGYYDAEGTINNNSSRYIATVQGRSCIALVDGQATPYAGAITLTVSPLSWRNNSFYTDETNTKLIIDDSDNSFKEGGDDKSIPRWRFQQEEIPEPYRTKINECLRDNEYKSTRELLDFSTGISLNGSQLDSSASSVYPPSPDTVRVQDLADGDYFFASGQPPNYFGDIFVFRKQGNSVIGLAAENPSDGSCVRQEILSDSQVRIEKVVQYDDSEGEAQINPETLIDDGSFLISSLSPVDVKQYTDFTEAIQACANMFPN